MPFIVEPTLGQTYLKRLKTSPNWIAFQYIHEGRWKSVRMHEFDAQVRQVSYGLMGLGVLPGEHVGIFAPTSYEWALADMAILGAGAVSVPIYPSVRPEEAAEIIEKGDVVAVIVDSSDLLAKVLEHKDELPKLRKIVVIDPYAVTATSKQADVLSLQALKEIGKRQETRAPRKFEKQLQALLPTDPFSICYTSGTTGTPKGAILTHQNLMSVLEDSVKAFRGFVRSEREILLTFLPFSHILGRLEGLAVYTFGWRVCFAQNQDTLVRDLLEVRPTVMWSVPRLFEKIKARIEQVVQAQPLPKRKMFEWASEVGRKYYATLDSGKKPSPFQLAELQLARATVFRQIARKFGGRLKASVCGGAPLPRDTAEYFRSVGLPVLEGYGLTETCAPVAVNTPEQMRLGTVGRPLSEVSIKTSAEGEILIRSKKVFAGYYKEPEETAKCMDGDWFKTGDIGYLDSDGFLTITDRIKDLIITSAGKNIAPQKIEKLLNAKPLIQYAVVVGDRRKHLAALLTLDREAAIEFATREQILYSDFAALTQNPKILAQVQRSIEDANAELASYETIKKFVVLPKTFTVESGELTPSLKPKRKAITKTHKAEIDRMYME